MLILPVSFLLCSRLLCVFNGIPTPLYLLPSPTRLGTLNDDLISSWNMENSCQARYLSLLAGDEIGCGCCFVCVCFFLDIIIISVSFLTVTSVSLTPLNKTISHHRTIGLERILKDPQAQPILHCRNKETESSQEELDKD